MGLMLKIDHILEKGTGPVNEDRILLDQHLFGVFDGATSLADPADPAGSTEDHILPSTASLPTGGARAASIARDVFARNHFPLPRLAGQANTAIRQAMNACGISEECAAQVWSTSAAVVRIKKDTAEWFKTGDSQILVIYEDGDHEILGRFPDHDYPSLSMMKKMQDNTLDNPVLRRQVLSVRQGMNRTYGVLNGDDRARKFFSSGTISLADVRTILLFTDGLSLPCEDPAPEREYTRLVRSFKSLGLAGLHEKIRRIEKTDPHRKRFPRFKCHDDIAAIALTFQPAGVTAAS